MQPNGLPLILIIVFLHTTDGLPMFPLVNAQLLSIPTDPLRLPVPALLVRERVRSDSGELRSLEYLRSW
ncbi:hypothetical protein NUW54_g8870 [Trametes sanguinea]|uniref:Uncharacterized protein n=1 Tax=Trametes sanguinea TaxID=158606 RepID=A0ACC1PCJ2_9APHY|nr:hypothetical protein NUW54_g8870 [Trametes sanguinea]